MKNDNSALQTLLSIGILSRHLAFTLHLLSLNKNKSNQPACALCFVAHSCQIFVCLDSCDDHKFYQINSSLILDEYGQGYHSHLLPGLV